MVITLIVAGILTVVVRVFLQTRMMIIERQSQPSVWEAFLIQSG